MKRKNKISIYVKASKLTYNSISHYFRNKKWVKKLSIMPSFLDLREILQGKRENTVLILEESSVHKNYKQYFELKKNYPELKIFVLYQNIDLFSLYNLIQMGVSGFLNPDWSEKQMTNALEKSQDEEFIFPRKLITDLIESAFNKSQKGWEKFAFSRKEIKIAKLLTEGLTNKEIAKQARIKEKTVKAHLTHIYAKLSCSNRIEAVRKLLTCE